MGGCFGKDQLVVGYWKEELKEKIRVILESKRAIKIEIEGRFIRAVYGAVGGNQEGMENWLQLLEGIGRRQSVILLGDWNAHCKEWDTESREDGKGKVLREWMGGNGFRLVQPDVATWRRFREEEISTLTIDLVWTKEIKWQPKTPEGLMLEHKIIWGDIVMEREEVKEQEREVIDWGGILGFAEDLKEKQKEEEERIYEITEGETPYNELAYL